MKHFRVFFIAIAIVAIFLTGSGTAFAQAMHGKWFELKVSAKGYEVDMAEDVYKLSGKTTAYMHMDWDTNHYDYYIFSETSPGVWQQTDDGTFSLTISTEDYIFLSDDCTIAWPDGTSYHFYFTALIRVKLDKLGALSSASLATLGAAVDTSSSGVDTYGGATVKGKVIDSGKLPFDL